MKIDHWIARSDPDRGHAHELDWLNLIGACPGTTQTIRHCDTSRGDAAPHDQGLWLGPVEGRGSNPCSHLRCLRSGKLEASPELSIDEHVRVERDINLLNLNAAPLVRNRKAVLDAVEQRLRSDGFNIRALQRELADLDRGEQAREHTEILREYLLRKLRRHGL